ncbi:MAG: flagellar hook-length control protein FliK [Sulfuricurvum sp.]|uniref:flagellar hook-length control protein FliK n=1 Tax=Sulfuricurvum sp. TaxID=2025608 RepID=UPI0026319E4D|nr:flagellar hook-length control protein FliK [Sulfuricurvum sp.]MDD5160070.1 flagellar hook-length control protein FliK [Sulfuricurvum sp.]
MITLPPEARLNILLPNMNKALGEAIKNATPEQLETLKEGKDLKGLLTSVFQDKITSTKSDTVLLDILKNSTVFKKLGSLTDNLQSLLKELKTSPDLSPKTAVLEKFLKNIALIDTQTLKNQVTNSGVFMESKFAAALQKLPDLTQTLEQLSNVLSKSPQSEAKVLQRQILTLLENPILSTSSQNFQNALTLTDTLKKVTDNLHTLLSKSDPLYSKEVSALAQKLDQISVVQELKTTLSQLYGTLLRSSAPDTNELLDSIEKLLKNLNNAPTEALKTFTQQLKSAINEGDITKELSSLITKLSEFTNPKELVSETFLQESMADDLKSNLLSLHEELTRSSDPNAPTLLEQTDKLLTQIDYHQLISYLGASNSIYIPFAWDQLEEGSMAFKKTAGEKFYCEINLRLKEYGELNLMMALYEGNQLEIQAHTEKPELKTLIQENISQLRSLLINADLTPRSIRVFEMKETLSPLKETYTTERNGTDLGFEVKV